MTVGNGVRAALIGCGGNGQEHARNALELGVELVAFCDLVEGAAERMRAAFGGRYATSDAGRVLRDDGVDLLIVSTHHDAHHPLALAGARAGKHMLLEKPLCLTRRLAVEVAEAVEQSGVKAVVDHWFRATPAAQTTRRLIPRPRLSHGQLAMPSSPGHWVWRPNEGGGLLVGTACHTVDLLAYLIDSEPERVYAEGQLFDPEGKGGAGYYDAVVGTILWRNGTLSTVISGDQGQNRVASKWFHEVWDGQRSAVLSAHLRRADFDGCDLDHVDTEEWPEPKRRKVERAYPILANLLEVIRAGGETLCTVRDGVRAVAICEALGSAARTGRPHSVPL